MSINYDWLDPNFSNSFSIIYLTLFFDYFEISCICRLLFTDVPVDIYHLENFINSISEISFIGTFKNLLKKKIVNFYRIQKGLFLNLNFKKNLCKNFYQKRPKLTPLRKNISGWEYSFSKDAREENLLLFLIQGSRKLQFKASLQLFLIFKNLGFLDNDWTHQIIKISGIGLKLLFQNQEKQFSKILKNLDRRKKKYCKQIFPLSKGSYNIFQKQIFTLKSYTGQEIFKEWKMNYSSLDFFYRLDPGYNKRGEIIHCFFNQSVENLPFFHEIGICFFPCLSDKIFISRGLKIQPSKKFLKNIKNGKKSERKFQIVVESNYRIYVYRKKYFSSIIFGLFSEPFYQLPNLFVGEITEKSITKALKRGITSLEILNFLGNNLHEICPNVPKTVSDQIKVWEFQKKKNMIYDSLIFWEKNENFLKPKEILFGLSKKGKFPKSHKIIIIFKH